MTVPENPMWLNTQKLDRLMNVQEVADHLGMKKQTLYKMRMTGRGPRAIRVGKFLRYRLSDLTAFEEDNIDPQVAT